MADSTPKSAGQIEVPSVDQLRQLGCERLMTYFLTFDEIPPSGLEAMAQAAHDLLERHAPEEAAKWEEALRRNDWVPLDDVLRDFGILDEEGPPNESAA